ncbi:MAG TPA: methylmalonyl Co-A mutase-associated GTPase MeaB [Desulfotignum sp.]|nr:methylmalonyl Co-A mutase-associated GTPase MeaB [Desulfotignum sp.]
MPEKAPDIQPDPPVEIHRILDGDVMAGAGLIRRIEAGDPAAARVLGQLHPYAGKGFVIGITGPPGAGKSTLISALITMFRKNEFTVGVVAVDPSSHKTGGAVLGDRVRMQSHAGDKGVFIRSMAARGAVGGLARATRDTCLVLDAMGYNIIIVEPVGSGQADIDISTMVHSLCLVAIPGTGDGIQSVKAGVLEAADLFVVNKNDLPGAQAEVLTLENLVAMRSSAPEDWQPLVVGTCARTGQGVDRLADLFLDHRQFMKDNRLLERKQTSQAGEYFNTLVRQMVMDRIDPWIGRQVTAFLGTTAQKAEVAADPYQKARELADRLTRGLGESGSVEQEGE